MLFILIALLLSRLEYLDDLDLELLGLGSTGSFRSGENAISQNCASISGQWLIER